MFNELNVLFFFRVFRNSLPKCQYKQENEITGNLSCSKISNIMYTGDNCVYDEVGEVSKNQEYDELQWWYSSDKKLFDGINMQLFRRK